ncbi:MAG: hypothetical protein BIFFINMI_03572 [Phycisphaerae bacterium]|nr:hypothetical protein [Phycisphaerae bacterium]
MADWKFKIDGLKELEAQLKDLASEKTAKKILRSAATKAIRPMRKEAKAQCPKDTGALKKSIDSKVNQRGMRVSAIVGSDTSVLEDGTKATAKDQGPRAARHLHLVINGHITPEGKAVPANDFLTRAAQATQGQCLTIYEDSVRDGIERAVDETGGT